MKRVYPTARVVFVITLATTIFGCKEASTVSPSYYANVKPIIDSKCVHCHDDAGLAPFQLKSYEAVFSARDIIKTTVQNQTMPPWLAASACNEYAHDASLSPKQLKTILDWVDTGAEEGDIENEGPPVVNPARETRLTREDLILKMPIPYTPTVYPDDYRCFVLDWTAGPDEGYATGFRADPGNLSIAHHVVAFLVPPDQVAAVEARDAADEGNGYQCFGGPGGDELFTWLGAWAPGSLGNDFPEGTGMKLEEGSKIVMQMHYNMAYAAPEPDVTTISLKIEKEVEKEATILLWLNPAWVRRHTMDIPAGQSSIVHHFAAQPSGWLGLLSGGKALQPGDSFNIHRGFVHLHELGTGANLWLEKENGDTPCLLDIPRWDYNWQFGYSLKKPIRVDPGDTLHVECRFDNSEDMQRIVDGQLLPPRDVNWGDGTQDEMCIGILNISEI